MPELLKVENAVVRYPLRGGVFGHAVSFVEAVSGVSFGLAEGEILAIVGESGCGKSTLAQALVGLVPWHSGKLFLNGEAVEVNSEKVWRQVRSSIQMVFQDPYTSLNPRHRVSEILGYPLAYKGVPAAERERRAREVLSKVGLPKNSFDKFPHEFSGGQRQRLGIARALMTRPKVLICDEVTSALDVSVQAQILQLLEALRRELGLSLIFISHDMQVVRVLSDRVMVMYLGKMMEEGPVAEVFETPLHAYTKALIRSVPTLDFGHRPECDFGERDYLDGDTLVAELGTRKVRQKVAAG